MKNGLEAAFRRLEQRLGIDREGRTVWVWLLPPAIGLCTAILAPFMPGLPSDLNLFYRLLLSLFALVTMTAITSIYLITFDNDHNQQAAVDDEPDRGDHGPDVTPPPTGPQPPRWLQSLDDTDEPVPEPAHTSVRVPTGAKR